MSKYEPLQTYLARQPSRELPMTFEQVERLLNFPLPRSARTHPQWWSNNVGSHVAVKAWRDAGWKTSRVDVGGESVVFVREAQRSAGPSPDPDSDVKADAPGDIVIAWADLRDGHRRLLQDIMAKKGVSLGGALTEALDMAFRERRREVLEWAAANARQVENPSDSVDLIREDRDRDEF